MEFANGSWQKIKLYPHFTTLMNCCLAHTPTVWNMSYMPQILMVQSHSSSSSSSSSRSHLCHASILPVLLHLQQATQQQGGRRQHAAMLTSIPCSIALPCTVHSAAAGQAAMPATTAIAVVAGDVKLVPMDKN
jgi:hypothetical protein